MRETVLVTGADGFIGRTLVPWLDAGGFEVWAHTRAQGDLAAQGPSRAGARAVVHLAGRTFVPESWHHPDRYYRDNTLATVNVLEYCRSTGARLVHVSAYVYGIPEHLPIKETHPLRATNPYTHSKILAEEVVRFYSAQFQVPATIIRPFNVYGPGQDARFIIPSIVRQAIDPALSTITVETLEPRRDYLHVDDLASIVEAALRAAPGGTYNAGSGEATAVGAVVDLVRAMIPAGKPANVTGHARAHDVSETVADITRAGAELGWRPRISLRSGLARLVAESSREMP